MLELYHVMKRQDFLSSSEFCIQNELKVDGIKIEVGNRTELNLVGQEAKVYRIEKFGIQPSFSQTKTWLPNIIRCYSLLGNNIYTDWPRLTASIVRLTKDCSGLTHNQNCHNYAHKSYRLQCYHSPALQTLCVVMSCFLHTIHHRHEEQRLSLAMIFLNFTG